MSLRSKTIFAVLATVLAFIASFSGTLNAAWVKVQDSPAVYRDTRTNLEWTVTLGSVCSNVQAQSLVQKYGFRLPTPCELQDVINCSCGACQLCLYSGHRNAYETCDPCTLVSVRHCRAVVKARRACSRTWVVGVRGGSGQDPNGQIGKLYVLTVWGTNEPENMPYYTFFANSFKRDLTSSFLCPIMSLSSGGIEEGNSKEDSSSSNDSVLSDAIKTLDQTPEKIIGGSNDFCAEYITLKGDTATNEKVLEMCRYLSQKAQKNDVIFVYMCCHGNSKTIGNKRHHVLYPAAKDLTALEDIENGIKREDIIQALKENEHRLTVLITDSCARRQDQSALYRPTGGAMAPACAMPGTITTTRLEILLRTNTGFINWNSSAPNGAINDEGEYSFFFQKPGENGLYQAPEGIFYSTFEKYALDEPINILKKYPYTIVDPNDPNNAKLFENIDPNDNNEDEDQSLRQTPIVNNPIDASTFYSELKQKVHDFYAECKGNEDITKAVPEMLSQPTQTLFNFEDNGYVVDDDIDIDEGNTEGDTGNTEGDTGNTEGDAGNTEGDTGNTEGDTGNTEGDAGNTEGDNGKTEGDTGKTEGDPDDIIKKIEGDGSTKN